MESEVVRADARMRMFTLVVLAIAVIAAVACVAAFSHWLGARAARLPTDLLVVELRHWIGIACTGMALCLLLLAGYAMRLARRVTEARRWPLPGARPLRDTPLRRNAAALRMAGWFRAGAVLALALALACGAIGLRLSLLAA